MFEDKNMNNNFTLMCIYEHIICFEIRDCKDCDVYKETEKRLQRKQE